MAMEVKTHISVQDLTVSYGQQRALNNITIDIPDRKITVIMGPSGCGKTTLLKAFNRLIELQDGVKVSGRVLIDGEDIYAPKMEVTHLRKKVGLLLQRPQVLPMSIYDNVAYGPKLHGVKDKKKLDLLVEQYLRESSLWNEVKDRLHSSASRLSIGQQQRLCLSRALAVEPEVILGDEPTSALDPISAEKIEQRFLELKNRYTIVLVTHILRQAQRLADHVIFLYLGDLIEHGPAEKVLRHPKYYKTQRYLGGRFIEEPKVSRTLELKGISSVGLPATLRDALRSLGETQILEVMIDEETLVSDISSIAEAEGHSVLEVKRLNHSNWKIMIQKKGDSYII